jgi:hypothetical protein
LRRWIERGYNIMLWCDSHEDMFKKMAYSVDDRPGTEPRPARFNAIVGEYPGYYRAVNALIKWVLKDPKVSWVVCGGDDTFPDPNFTAEEIAEQLTEHFSGTFGVAQPVGDLFAGNCIVRICGSPWIGRDFALSMNQGKGPFWPEYTHCFGDEEMFEVTKKLGVLWQRRDLTHHHEHWTRNGDNADYSKPMPEFLREANSPAHWAKYKALFESRKAAGFPGHEPFACGGIVENPAPHLVGE